ncbi:MAG: hypothetical protein JWO36_228 [Myxococcales bacterium]|nr:hypothetical protein [Myxococcales bacterium]
MARLTTLQERDQPSVIVDPAAKAVSPANVQMVSPTRPKLRDVGPAATQASSGAWFVIVIYVLSAGALAYALYERFGG